MRIGVDVTSARTAHPSGIAWVATNLVDGLWRLGCRVVPLSRIRRHSAPPLPARIRPVTFLSLFGSTYDALILTDTRDLSVKARVRVAIIHDLISLQNADYAPPHFKAKKQAAYLHICRRADAIVTPSRAVAREVQHRLPVPWGGVHAVAWGVNRVFVDGDVDEARLKRLGVRRPFILCVGTLCRRKRQAELVEAFRRRAVKGVQLVLVGRDGYGATAVRDAAKNSGNVRIVGHLEPATLSCLYRSAAVVINVSEYEGFCLPVYEGCASGTAVVTTPVADVREDLSDAAVVVEDVEEGVEAALELVANEKWRRSVGRACMEAVREMNWETTAAQFVRLLRRLTAAKKRMLTSP